MVPPEKRAEVEAKIGMSLPDAEAQLEYYILATPGSLRGRIPGFDPNGSRRVADAELAAFKAVLGNIHRDGTSISGRPADAIYVLQLAGNIRGNFRRALTKAGYADTFTMPLGNSGEITDFIKHLPTQRVATELKIHYARNSQTNWKINHLRDIKALSVAIPYTDAVVTDRDVYTTATARTHLDQEFNTAVFSQLTELRDFSDCDGP